MLKKLFNLIICTFVLQVAVYAQEINCKVKVQGPSIQGVDKEVFRSMERSLNDFINTRKWTNDNYNTSEKIECNIMLNLTKVLNVNDGSFEATLNIQATRPVYNTGYNSPTLNYVDREVRFRYNQYAPLQFDDNRVSGSDPLASNLTAVVAYYIYLVIGLDYDSFAPNGGTDYFKKAQNIVNNAPEQGKDINGWKAVEGTKNRYWIVDQILSPRYNEFRRYWYSMHREGLDNLYTKPEEARKTILSGIGKLVQLNKENPNSILIQMFFTTKSNEIMSVLSQTPKTERTTYISMLQQVDVPNAQKYANLK